MFSPIRTLRNSEINNSHIVLVFQLVLVDLFTSEPLTVGSGVTPDLLTLLEKQALAGFLIISKSPPVGNFTPP
ncbi:hypothetical protein HRM2_28360 [Desulforapulum autotrophicum HRM2]|uniref:Uncharacterized protein n=1 Tax=Desulforapulum autotrophicum (strain ATCC 43914 / DSM 3382 / VKM B-1955 / HRM2) TaxID=177437 RepID=C0QJB1_DESAH|nr:hypothetical protein HRM2_28360 [Desulforapulum autotrophicum HRM2]